MGRGPVFSLFGAGAYEGPIRNVIHLRQESHFGPCQILIWILFVGVSYEMLYDAVTNKGKVIHSCARTSGNNTKVENICKYRREANN